MKRAGNLGQMLLSLVLPLLAGLALAAGVAAGVDQAAAVQANLWTFETVDGRDDVGRAVSLAVDGEGQPRLTYLETADGEMASPLHYAFQAGGQWAIETIDGDGGRNSLVIDEHGRPHVSFHRGAAGGLAYAVRTDLGWQVEVVDSSASAYGLSSLALDSQGRPHVLYSDGLVDELRYARWNGADWEIDLVLASPFDIWGLDFALDSLDRPHFTYHEIRMQLYEFLARANYGFWDGASWQYGPVWSATAPNDGGDVGFDVCLALDSNDRPHIALFDVNNWSGHLVYLYLDGSGFLATPFADGSSLGGGLDLVLDAVDRPHIVIADSFYYHWRGALKYLWYTGSDWQLESLAGAADIGRWVALGLDCEQPLVAFQDLNQADLVLARRALLAPASLLPLVLATP